MRLKWVYGAVFLATSLNPLHAEAEQEDVAKLRKVLASHILPCDKADFPSGLTHAELVAAFGAHAVSSVTNYGAEGEGPSWQETILFANVPDDSIQIVWKSKTWKSDKQAKGVDALLVQADAGDAKALAKGLKWRGPGGLQIGSTITEIEAVNGKPFEFHGLGWDYGGVYGWNGGTLDGKPGSCSLYSLFIENPKVPQAATDKVEGEHKFQSTDPDLRAADPIAMSLRVQLVR